MMSTRTRNMAMVFWIGVFCAALAGCSSSDNGMDAELQEQLDMAQAARMTAEEAQAAAEAAQTMAEQERDAAEAARMTAEQERASAEQALIDTRVALAAADKVRDAAAYGAEKLNRVGDIIIIGKQDGWDSADYITGWRSHIHAANSGSQYTSVSQSYREGGAGFFVPSYDEEGNLQVIAGSGLGHIPWQRDPDIWPFRSINTYFPAGAGRTTSLAPIDGHGLGAAWHGTGLTAAYEGAGTITMRLFTDLAQADNPGDAYSNHPATDAAYPNIALDDVPALPAGWDGQWIYAGGLHGSVDGVPGSFSCAEGSRGFCGFETYRPGLTPGYFADVAGDPVIFTPDDDSDDVTLPHPAPTTVPTVNYLAIGSWLFVPEDVTDLDAYDFGVFASGDDPFLVDGLQGLEGTASYAGGAAGTYADAPQARLDPFEAKVELTADFGTAEDFGSIVGRVYDFAIAGGKTSPLRELGLNRATWFQGGTSNISQSWEGGLPVPGGWVEGNAYMDTGTARWQGSWGGKFFGNGAAASDVPGAFGGTFGATDGDHSFAGSFGARRQ